MGILIHALHITNTANHNPKKPRHWRQHHGTRMGEFEVMQRQITRDQIRICNMERELNAYKQVNARLKTFAKLNVHTSKTNQKTIEELLNLIEELYGEGAFDSGDE